MPVRTNISLWMDQIGEQPDDPPLHDNEGCDVAIVGAGYTGLWTAYYLKRRNPGLAIRVLEGRHVGFGASGRNGGWLMGEVLGADDMLATLAPQERHRAFQLLHGIVDEVRTVTEREGIACDLAHGGVIYAAGRYREQLNRLDAFESRLRAAGHDETDYRRLDKGHLASHLNLADGMAGLFSPHVAAIHPAKLVAGLAQVLRQAGVMIHGHSPVREVQPGKVTLLNGHQVTARHIVVAIEGFAPSIELVRPHVLPVQSLIIATEPLSEAQWQEIGLANRQVFSDLGRQVTYGQRTADGRLIFGARGGYLFGGRVKTEFSLDDPAFASRKRLMHAFFPGLGKVEITHGWGGTLGMPRALRPHVVMDGTTGLVTAGGYSGEGVGASNLFGRTVASLIVGDHTPETIMPWVRRSPISHLPRWEPEPLRWLGYKAVDLTFALEDRVLSDPQSSPLVRRLTSSFAAASESLLS